jgi:glycosyltransferase involved in cell wall biosynthesis
VDLEHFIRLERTLDGAHVVCVGETHIASSAQACTIRERHSDMRVAVTCFENIPFRYEDEPTLARRKDLVRRAADLFIAVTPEARAALLSEGVDAGRIALQPYGVDDAHYHPDARDADLRASWGAEEGDCVILYAGRLIREKGLAQLLWAVASLREHPVRLVFTGSGTERLRLARMAEALGVDDLVRFTGWVSSRSMPRVLASADIVAMPSLTTPYWTEQLGFGLIEAMACGVPVVATRSGSIPFVVGDAGTLVEPYDVSALADALRALVLDPVERSALATRGRARVETELNVRTVGQRLGGLFTQIARD